MDDIYQMKIHDEIHLGEKVVILRVPGGWIYTTYCDMKPTSVFVPYHREFNIDKEKYTE